MGGQLRVGVLASGGGTNLQALLDGVHGFEAKIVAVASDKVDAVALERARGAGVPTSAFPRDAFPDRPARDAAIADWLGAQGVELVVLAGYMAILDAGFIARFPDAIINVHPSLLPAFPGVHGQKQAFDYGVKVAGCTVHFVELGVDSGPIIAQSVVPVLEDDDAERLRLRILAEEHKLLPAVVRALAEGRVTVEGRRVRVRPT